MRTVVIITLALVGVGVAGWFLVLRHLPPQRITDLRVLSVGSDSITIQWSAPKRAHRYDLRYASVPIDEKNFPSAQEVYPWGFKEPQARAPGTYTLKGLLPCQQFWFAIRSIDNESWFKETKKHRWSKLSNIAMTTTLRASALTYTGSRRPDDDDSVVVNVVEYPCELTHRFRNSQMSLPSPCDVAHRMVALGQPDGLTHYLWLSTIRRMERQPPLNAFLPKFTVTLRNGRTLTGVWKPSYEFYYYDGRDVREEGLAGLVGRGDSLAWAYLPIGRVQSLEVVDDSLQSTLTRQALPSRRQAVLELRDARRLTGFHGHFIDYCGHWWSTNWHLSSDEISCWFGESAPGESTTHYLVDSTGATREVTAFTEPKGSEWIQTVIRHPNPLAQPISTKKIQMISFTGDFDNNLPSCRKATLEMRDGSVRNVILEFTSESHGGAELHHSMNRHLDSYALMNEHGTVVVPLNNIRSITFE